MPQISKQKHGLITTLVSGFIGLAYEGISSFLQRKCNDALQKAMIAMNSEAEFQCNKLLKLDNTMLLYGIYNTETLEKLNNTVQELHNMTSSHEKLFAGEHNPTLFRILYTNALGVQQYAFNSLLFLRIVQDKYISLYKELVTQLKSYISAIRILAKSYLPTTLITSSKLQEILKEVTKSLQQTNPDYALVLDRLHLYYDMRLVTFGIDREMNLVIQFPVFIQPYIQKPLALYQLKTVPVPILDTNINAQSYTHLHVNKPYIALNSETYISLTQQELRSGKKTDDSGCGTLAYIGIALTLLSMAIVILLHYRKSKFCRGHKFSNIVKIVLFISDVQHYIPIKLCKTLGSLHLFKITGMLTSEDIKLKRNYLWDTLEINWDKIKLAFNSN